jgi:hypothetical protein
MNQKRILLLLPLLSILAMAETRIDLRGKWERWVGDQLHDVITVPSSYRPIGTAVLRRTLDLPPTPPAHRVLLRFQGVAHHAEVRVNNTAVGSMGPWTPYDFDITESVRPGANRIDVEVTDWQVPLGPIGAWEASGGIIRDVSLETRTDPYIANAHLQYKLAPAFDSASCSLEVYLNSTQAAHGRLAAELLHGGVTVSEAFRDIDIPAGESQLPLRWELKPPFLWTPETPNLYMLRVRLATPAGEDVYTAETGFRDLRIRGNQFLLNGKNLVLRGVCRHDIWKDEGHTMTDAQIEQDLTMIKAMGANFIRLVHYPHDGRVIRTANRAGLLVTEESGLVWLDFRKISREALETGIGNLERTIRRDWNCPALFAVLLANESSPTLEAIQEARRRVRALAPDLFMSSARIDSPERTFAGSKRLFDEGGLDFYTDHKYGYDMRMFEQSVSAYTGKPVVFTEWGGRAIGQSPVLMRETTERIGRLVEQGRLAGYSFWSWADLPEFSRVDPEMEGGILKSGVVTEDRTPRMDVYAALMALYRRLVRPIPPPERQPQILASQIVPLSAGSEFTPISLQPARDDPSQAAAWSELEALMERFWKFQGFTALHWEETGRKLWLWDAPKLKLGGIPFETPLQDGATRPLAVTPQQRRLEIAVGLRASRLHFLGNVTLPDGYPVLGKLGERVGRYIIEYEGGERQEVPLRWGEEVARSNLISVATRIDAATAHGERVVLFAKDPVREVHQTRLLSVDTKDRRIARIFCELDPSAETGTTPPAEMHHSTGEKPGPREQALLLFAITAERRN